MFLYALCLKSYFLIKLLKIGFVANDSWRQEPAYDLIDHKYWLKIDILLAA